MTSRSTMILAVHSGLIASIAWLALSFDLKAAAAAATAVVCIAPLLLGIRGLRLESRYTQQWVAIALVFYLGVGLAETIASQARSGPAILLLLTSAIELLMLLSVLRSDPRASGESAES